MLASEEWINHDEPPKTGREYSRPFVLETMAKEFARQFYSSKRWQACRNGYAAYRGHLCENCLRQGIYKPGVIVHHVEELTPLNINRPEIALDWNNLELLCRECHNEIHGNTGGRWAEVNRRRKAEKKARQRYFIDENGKVFAKSLPL